MVTSHGKEKPKTPLVSSYKEPETQESLPEVEKTPEMPPPLRSTTEAPAEDKRELPLVKDLADPEWLYVMDYEEDGELYELVFAMQPYLAYDMKLLLDEVSMTYEPHDQRRIGMSAEGNEAYGPFFDKYFRRIDGLLQPGSEESVSHEDMIAWINENDPSRAIKRGVVRGGMGNVNSIVGSGKKKGLVMKLGRAGSTIKCWRVLWNPEKNTADKLFVDHHVIKETDKDRRQYDQATGKSEIIRKKESSFMRSDQNFDAYEQLYDRLIDHLVGYLFEGKPCTKENKDKWVRLVPFWEKYFVVDEIFRSVQSKNA